MKPRAILLSELDYGDAGPRYRVEKLTDTVEYSIGELLSKQEVAQLCELLIWKVTIQPAKANSK